MRNIKINALKKQYFGLDEVGFEYRYTGKRINANIKKDIEKPIQYIKSQEVGKVITLPKRCKATFKSQIDLIQS